MEDIKETKKELSPNLKLIIATLGNKKELTIEDLKKLTGKSSNCLIACACASSNKEYVTYHSKKVITYDNGSEKVELQRITLTEKGLQYHLTHKEK